MKLKRSFLFFIFFGHRQEQSSFLSRRFSGNSKIQRAEKGISTSLAMSRLPISAKTFDSFLELLRTSSGPLCVARWSCSLWPKRWTNGPSRPDGSHSVPEGAFPIRTSVQGTWTSCDFHEGMSAASMYIEVQSGGGSAGED